MWKMPGRSDPMRNLLRDPHGKSDGQSIFHQGDGKIGKGLVEMFSGVVSTESARQSAGAAQKRTLCRGLPGKEAHSRPTGSSGSHAHRQWSPADAVRSEGELIDQQFS